MPVWPYYVIFILLILLYAKTGNIALGILSFLMIVVILYVEAKTSVKAEGTKKTVVDIAVAIGAALVLWVLLMLVLHTYSPLDAVASCSMLPTLQRGDLVVLSGITNFTQFIDTHHIPVINMTSQEFSYFESNINNEFLTYYAYMNGNKSYISEIVPSTGYNIGLYNTKCLSTYSYLGQQSNYYKCYVASQSGNLIKYNYGIGKMYLNGKIVNIVYTSSITIGNETIYENYSNPIIVYRTTSSDSFSGDIIHRVYAAIDVNGKYYMLTKGDNNPGLDIEFSNYPPGESSVVGYNIASVPVIGYLKLVLSGEFATPSGCNQTIIH